MSKIEAKKIQTLLKELGHKIPLGHCYELTAKLRGYPSWNVASKKRPQTSDVALGSGPKLFEVKIVTEAAEAKLYVNVNADSEEQAKSIAHEWMKENNGLEDIPLFDWEVIYLVDEPEIQDVQEKTGKVPVVTAQVFETIRNEILEKYEFVGKCECCGIDTYRDPNGYNDPRGPLGLNAVSMIYASEYSKEGRDIVACFPCTNEEPKYRRLMKIAEEKWIDGTEKDDLVFKGIRDSKRNIVTVNGHPLPECLDILNKSPDGFEWGYGGSGPSQLALAISVHLVGKEMALKVYQDLKEKFISPIKEDSFTLSGKEMRRFLQSCFASL